MTHNELQKFERLLIQKKQEFENILELMKKNESAKLGALYSNEISNYDNHPADNASDVYEVEKNISLKADVKRRIDLIEDALTKIQKGSYGVCVSCKKPIDVERLKAIPYTPFCIECENEYEKTSSDNENTRPIEEKVLGKPFNDRFNSQSAEEEYEGIDMWNILEMHSTSNGPQDNMKIDAREYYKKINEIDDTVENTDKISNKDNREFFGD